MFKDSFNYINDNFICSIINEFLNETKSAEIINQNFESLIDNMFKNKDLSIYIDGFLVSDKNNIIDSLWMKATSQCISDVIYTTFGNVGGYYYKILSTEFASNNKMSLINDFIKKYCEEKEIRLTLLNKVLSSNELLTSQIGDLLGGIYREESTLRNEEKASASIAFEVYSKEIISYELPQLQNGKVYSFKNSDGEGVGNIIDDKLEFRPPTVFNTTTLYAELLVVNEDGIVENRNGFNIKVKPPKYIKPTFKTYRLKPSSTLDIGLEPVEENYKYYVSVPKGFGEVSVDEFMLSYTAPTTALSQNVGVRLALVWNDKTIVYDTVVNFSVVVDDDDVDTSDSGNAFAILKQKVQTNTEALETVKNNSDSSTIIINGNIFENLD